MGEEAEITELRLGPPRASSVDTSIGGKSKKRAFTETVEDESSTTEEGEGVGVMTAAEDEEPAAKGRVMGWPPVCAYRQRNGGGGGCRRVYVKVSMDGAPFLRKLELDACKGYGDLTAAVEGLFAIRGSEGGEFTQIYEDREGDWMLVGDVPWEMFVESCKRLRLMKSSEAKGFGLQLRTPHGGGSDQEDVM